ncbi:MAG: hypothetical protein ACI92Z_003764 [Paracoccaceae bacterium]|jgi:hypothetical protein
MILLVVEPLSWLHLNCARLHYADLAREKFGQSARLFILLTSTATPKERTTQDGNYIQQALHIPHQLVRRPTRHAFESDQSVRNCDCVFERRHHAFPYTILQQIFKSNRRV